MPMIHTDVGGSFLDGVNWGDIGGAAGDIFSAIGAFSSSSGLEEAAALARKNAHLEMRMTALQEIQQNREAYQVIGGQQADIASAGFSASGSAIDLLKSSMQQASLDNAKIAITGEINKNQFLAQAAAYEAQAGASEASGIGGLVSAGLTIASMFSDERIKTDIETSHYDNKGRRWVNFRYLWDAPGTRRQGVIAQEILKTDPDAVREDENGILLVDYTMLAA